jgi:hypothetical protein
MPPDELTAGDAPASNNYDGLVGGRLVDVLMCKVWLCATTKTQSSAAACSTAGRQRCRLRSYAWAGAGRFWAPLLAQMTGFAPLAKVEDVTDAKSIRYACTELAHMAASEAQNAREIAACQCLQLTSERLPMTSWSQRR